MDAGSIEKQFGIADVYDSTQVILNHNRIPGARGKCKDNAREGKIARRKGKQRAENLANGGDQSGEGDNYRLQERVLEVGAKIIIKIYGGIRPRMFSIRVEMLSLQVIWIGESYGAMGPISRWGDILKITTERAAIMIWKSKPISRPIKFAPKTTLRAKANEEIREPLNNFGAKCREGEVKSGFLKMKAGVEKKGRDGEISRGDKLVLQRPKE